MNSEGSQAFWELVSCLVNWKIKENTKADLGNKNKKVENFRKILQQGTLNYLYTCKVHKESFRIDKFWMWRILILHIYEIDK